jgi:FtsZ-binding cell division protein ZapB
VHDRTDQHRDEDHHHLHDGDVDGGGVDDDDDDDRVDGDTDGDIDGNVDGVAAKTEQSRTQGGDQQQNIGQKDVHVQGKTDVSTAHKSHSKNKIKDKFGTKSIAVTDEFSYREYMREKGRWPLSSLPIPVSEKQHIEAEMRAMEAMIEELNRHNAQLGGKVKEVSTTKKKDAQLEQENGQLKDELSHVNALVNKVC